MTKIEYLIYAVMVMVMFGPGVAAQADRWAQEQKTRELSITQLGSSKTLATVTY